MGKFNIFMTCETSDIWGSKAPEEKRKPRLDIYEVKGGKGRSW